MNYRFLLPIFSLLLLTQCNPLKINLQFDIEEEEGGYRQRMHPAKTADEWTQRGHKDLTQSYSGIFTHLYPELPPQEEWPSLLANLDDGKLAQAKNNRFRFRQADVKTQSKLFGALLKEDRDQAQALSRRLLKKTTDDDWFNQQRVRLILALSKDPEEGLQWLKTNHPQVLKPREPSNYSTTAKNSWDKKLAEGKVKEGIALLWKEDREDNPWKKRLSALEHLLKLGRILPDEELAKQAATRTTELLKKRPEEDKNGHNSYETSFHARSWISYQATHKEWQTLADYSAEIRERGFRERSYTYQHLESLDLLLSFHLLGEEDFLQDLTDYLHNHPLEKVLDTLDYKTDSNSESLAALAIRTLAKNEQLELAKNLSLYLLAENSSNDRYYEQLRALGPKLFGEFLAQLLRYDPFEERPLIWQAELALAEDKLAEATTLINKAIALDPSDGDQGKETRMKCYHVLARILQKEGKQEKADLYFNVVTSIREGEAADDYLYAGLIQEATTRYRAALGRYEDAYCLQSRLANTLARNGQFDEAVPHFEKAFELMPVSFGPRESHCLGCEGIFKDKRVQPIAERMLAKFIAKNPTNPRAPYLLGLVLEEMKDNEGAIMAYQKALELDPRYYNCANKLEQLLKENPKHFSAHQKLLKQIIQIAPYRLLQRQFSKRTDLKQAWLDASKVGPSPLALAPLPVKKELFDQQFGKSFSSQIDSTLALDGWTAEELLQGNELLQSIDHF